MPACQKLAFNICDFVIVVALPLQERRSEQV